MRDQEPDLLRRKHACALYWLSAGKLQAAYRVARKILPVNGSGKDTPVTSLFRPTLRLSKLLWAHTRNPWPEIVRSAFRACKLWLATAWARPIFHVDHRFPQWPATIILGVCPLSACAFERHSSLTSWYSLLSCRPCRFPLSVRSRILATEHRSKAGRTKQSTDG